MGDDLFDEVVEKLANAQVPVCVTAAAGCGKTTAIVKAVAKSTGKQLILTHTNAGVAALRSSLRKHSVSESKYRVETIASWLFKYSIAYPSMSGLKNARPTSGEWKEVYTATERLFEHPFVRDILPASYTGVFVDEYQDCEKQHHKIILKISECLPVRVMGDPLQTIFRFNNNQPVDWGIDVLPHFTILPELTIPHRWQKMDANEELGKSLIDIRVKLQNGESVDLTAYPAITWICWSEEQEIQSCRDASKNKKGTIVGIHQWRKNGYAIARNLDGMYQSVEEMDCDDLIKCVRNLEKHRSNNNFIGIVNELKSLILKVCSNRSPFQEGDLQEGLARLEKGDISAVIEIVDKVIENPNKKVYRGELITELKRTVQEFLTDKHSSLDEAAYVARYRTRVYGRKLDNKIISSTLLIKGLEFDHSIILNADQMQNVENFYVAVTRASKSLTVLSAKPMISFVAPNLTDTHIQ